MNKVKVILLILLVVASRAYSQGATATIGTINACPGDTVLIPVNVTNFTNISAITLFVSYNSSVLSFQGLSNVLPSLSGISSNAMTSPVVQVGVAWSSITPFTVTSGKLFDMRFVHVGGNCSLSITNETEIVNSSLDVINVTRINGTVSQNPTPVITSQPESITVKAGDDAGFSVSVSGTTTYQWMVSIDGGNTWSNVINISPYSGVNSDNLHISLVTPGMNNRKFRCKVTGTCSVYSNAATLTVDTATGIDPAAKGSGLILTGNYPNPFSDRTFINCNIPGNGDVRFLMINMLGKIIKTQEFENIPEGNFVFDVVCSDISEGTYFYTIEFKNNLNFFSQTKSMIIIR
jgi:hypothetical protein